MKIEIELPDWVKEKHLYILAGVELVAYKYLKQEWKIKSSRCNMCGKCCENFKKDRDTFPRVKDGKCEFLISEGKDVKNCALGFFRPWICCISPGLEDDPKCVETFS